MNENSEKTKRLECKKIYPSFWFTVFIVFLFVIGLWFFAPLISSFISDFHGIKDTPINEIGDSFGSLNALFSGLAFLGIIVTIFLQSKELRLQREELSDTRKVLDSQQKELVEQNKTQRLQRFETTLFHMISNYKDIVADSLFDDNGVKYTHKLCYKRLYEKLKFDLQQANTNDNDITKIKDAYNEFYNDNEFILGHYLRNLYRIFKFIDDTDYIYKKLKPFYADIVRAQLSNQELALLFYNAIAHPVGDGFKAYLIKYEILDNLEDRILTYKIHKKIIDKKAFGE